MKLNWFSPLPPAPTGIADYTGSLLPWLSQHAQVTLWTDQERWDPALEKHCEVRRFGAPHELPWGDVHAADLTVFHMGNNPDFHGAIWRVSQLHAGVVVIHDLRLQDFFWGILNLRQGHPADYLALMGEVYGAAGRQAGQRAVDAQQTLASLCMEYPLCEAAMANSLGAVLHTEPGFEEIAGVARNPVAYLPFPYAAADPAKFGGWTGRRRIPAKPPYQLVLLGYINPNRRIDSLLEALGGLPMRDQFYLRVYGPVWDEAHVHDKIRRCGLERNVKLHGYTPAARLDAAIADADLAINLRFPTMGEASMSQLQVWDHALPSIVTRTGWYGGLPEEAVRFVEVDREIADLQRHLTDFAKHPQEFAEIGARGRATLMERHAPETYVKELLRFFRMAMEYRPYGAVLSRGPAVGAGLRGWLTEAAVERGAGRLAEELRSFTGVDR